MQKRWVLNDHDPALAQSLSERHHISPLIAAILVNRSVTEDLAIERFLKPSLIHLPEPEEMSDMKIAVERLVKAIRQGEKITIYGDYDVDGTTATVLLVTFLQDVGAQVDYYIPHRIKEGYSLNVEALKKIKAGGTKVLVTVDNGISAVLEAKAARDMGLDLIITDHHEVPPELPQALAILNPKKQNDHFPGKELAGVGVAFYLVIGLRKALREAGMLGDVEPNLRQSLDLVAVGTIADMAPLVGINRILVKEGLKVLSRNPRLGLRALQEVAGVDGEVSSDQVGFRLGPRINAVGRLEEANLGVELLLTNDLQKAETLAKRLDQANIERQGLEDDIVQEALAMIEAQGLHLKYRSLVVANEKWHPGVVGIVASRLVEKYYLPAIVLAREDQGLKGSARSIRNFHLVDALRECSEHLKRFGGHRYAAGLSMDRDCLVPFVERFDSIVRQKLTEEDFIPSLKLEVESDLSSIDAELLQQLEKLEPFGLGNPEPILLLRGVPVRESRVVGEKHLRLKVGEGRKPIGAIGFRLAQKIPAVSSRVDLAFSPGWNEWNGSKNIQLRIVDLREENVNAMRN